MNPYDKCCLDIEGPLTETENVLTFQYCLSKFVIAVTICQQDTDTVSLEFVAQLILKYRIPATVLTDKCANFLSKIFKVCKSLKI